MQDDVSCKDLTLQHMNEPVIEDFSLSRQFVVHFISFETLAQNMRYMKRGEFVALYWNY
jgi:hypothetical protein